MFVSGSVAYTRYLTTTGTGAWKSGPKHLYASPRDYGSALMYEQGKVLYAGGSRTTTTAEVIDLDAAAPSWKWTGSMSVPRRHLNLTVLATGEVLATGGAGGTKFTIQRRGGAVTHAFDQNTRRLRLAFSADATGLSVTAPSNGNVAPPPGHYMLFIVNGSGVPSVARIVRLN